MEKKFEKLWWIIERLITFFSRYRHTIVGVYCVDYNHYKTGFQKFSLRSLPYMNKLDTV